MCRMRCAGSRCLVDGRQAHQPHQTANPVTADADAFTPQLANHLATAVKRILEEQLVDAAHQRQILRALAPIYAMTGPIVKTRPADRKKAALTVLSR